MNQLPVNLNVLKEGLNSLVLPSQTPLFTPHLYVLCFLFSFFSKTKKKENGKRISTDELIKLLYRQFHSLIFPSLK